MLTTSLQATFQISLAWVIEGRAFLARRVDWDWKDRAALQRGRPAGRRDPLHDRAFATRADLRCRSKMKGMCERWVHHPYSNNSPEKTCSSLRCHFGRIIRDIRRRIQGQKRPRSAPLTASCAADPLSRRSSATWAAAISKVALEMQPTSSARLCCAPLKPAANDPAQ